MDDALKCTLVIIGSIGVIYTAYSYFTFEPSQTPLLLNKELVSFNDMVTRNLDNLTDYYEFINIYASTPTFLSVITSVLLKTVILTEAISANNE